MEREGLELDGHEPHHPGSSGNPQCADGKEWVSGHVWAIKKGEPEEEEREVSGAQGKRVTGKRIQLCVASCKNVRLSRNWGGDLRLDREEGLVGLNQEVLGRDGDENQGPCHVSVHETVTGRQGLGGHY